MNLDLDKKQKMQKVAIQKTILAIVVSNLFQLSLHVLLAPSPTEEELYGVEEGLVLVRLSPKLFVPKHSQGKQAVSLVSNDQREIIPKAYLHPIWHDPLEGGAHEVNIEVPEEFLNLIVKRKSQWEVYPFSSDIHRKPLRRKNRYEITF